MAESQAQGWCVRDEQAGCVHQQLCLKRCLSERTSPTVLPIHSPEPGTALRSTISLTFLGKY